MTIKVGIGMDSEVTREVYSKLREDLMGVGKSEDDASLFITTVTKIIEVTTRHCVLNMLADLEFQLSDLKDTRLKETLKYQVKMSILLSLYGDMLQYKDKKYILELLDKTSDIKDSDVVVASEDRM